MRRLEPGNLLGGEPFSEFREVDRREIGVESIAPVEVDVLPSDRRHTLEDLDGGPFAAALQLREGLGENQRIVVDYRVADEPGALVRSLSGTKMTVERRYSRRHPVEFELTLRYRQRRFPIVLACNLSTDGMYVKIDNLTLPTGTLVEVEFDRWDREWLIPAVVVHGEARGVGLMFCTTMHERNRLEITVSADPKPLAARSVTPRISA